MQKVWRHMCAVNKRLMSVNKIAKAGARVVFDDDGNYIEDKQTGERIWMVGNQRGVLHLDVDQEGRHRSTGFQPARTMRCVHRRAIMPISPALEKSTIEGNDPREVEDGEGLSQSGDAEADEEEERRKSAGRTGPNMPTKIEQEEHARTLCPYRS